MLTPQQKSSARRIVWTLFTAGSFASTGFLATSILTAIVGRELTGSDALATMPGAVYQLGSSAAAFGWGYGMDKLGRRGGLALGLALGAVGRIGSVLRHLNSFPAGLFGGAGLVGHRQFGPAVGTLCRRRSKPGR